MSKFDEAIAASERAADMVSETPGTEAGPVTAAGRETYHWFRGRDTVTDNRLDRETLAHILAVEAEARVYNRAPAPFPSAVIVWRAPSHPTDDEPRA